MIVHPTRVDRYDRQMLERAIVRDRRLQMDDVMANIYSRRAMVLRIRESVMTLEKDTDTLYVAQMSGKMADIPYILETVKEVAHNNGMTQIIIDGRKGWQRVLKKYGFMPEGKRLRLSL